MRVIFYIILTMLTNTLSSAFISMSHLYEFTKFKDLYNKKYISLHDEQESFYNFQRNIDYITRRNKDVSSYRLAVNHFADHSFDAIHEKLLCNNFKQPRLSFAPDCKEKDDVDNDVLDWNDLGFVRPVKDQGLCGSCWAFSTVGALESMVHINTLHPYQLSEQELVDCSLDNYACQGGWMHKAMEYVKEKKGLYPDSLYPYTARSGSCNIMIPSNRRIFQSGCFQYVFVRPKSIQSLKEALYVNPVCVAVKVDEDFMFYKDGIFDTAIEEYPDINHAVLLTGINELHKTWTIKNSWGADWGLNGYMKLRIKPGSGVAGVNSYGVVPIYDSHCI